MTIQLKNKHILFALESLWGTLHYKLRYRLNELISADSEDDTVQTIDIKKEDLLQIFRAVSGQPEGVAAKINQEILAALVPQLMAEAQTGNEEATQILEGIEAIDVANKAMKTAKILNGKTQILA